MVVNTDVPDRTLTAQHIDVTDFPTFSKALQSLGCCLPGCCDGTAPHTLFGKGVSVAFEAVLQLRVNYEINRRPVIQGLGSEPFQ